MSTSSEATQHRHSVKFLFMAGGLLSLCTLAALPRLSIAGDLDSAKMALDKVKSDVNSESWDNIAADIKNTEDFLDGLPASDKDPVQKELDALKAKADTGLKDYYTKQILETAKGRLDQAAGEMADGPQQAAIDIGFAVDKLNSADAKKYVDPAQVTKMLARAKSLQAMADAKQATGKIDMANQVMADLDTTMAANPLKGVAADQLDSVVQDISSKESRIRGYLEGVPADDARAKAITDKLATYDKQVQAVAGAAMATAARENLDRMWKSQQEYFAGWADEKPGTTWNDYVHNSTEANSNLNMPKTVEMMKRMNGWTDESAVKDLVTPNKDDAGIKAILADAQKTYDAGAAKLNGAFNDVMGQAEKDPMPNDNVFREQMSSLENSADMWFKSTPYHDKNVARAHAITTKWNTTLAGAAQAQADALKQLTDQANAAWPAIAAAMKPTDGFTPDKIDQFKGKIIHLTGGNRLGWDYMPAAYNFAQDINGFAVAGKFAPNIAALVKSAHDKTGQELPDDNWDLYAVVEGPGKIDKRVNDTGTVKVDGQDVGTVSAEHHIPVDCAVVRIIALHVGPIGAGPDSQASAIQPGGSTPSNASAMVPTASGGGTPGQSGGTSAAAVAGASTDSPAAVASGAAAAPAGSSVFKTLEHMVEALLCLSAAGLVVLKSRAPALATNNPGVATSAIPVSMKSEDPITLAGLGIAGLGALWLLVTFIIGDLIPAGLLTVSGIYIASDFLRSKNILPADLLAKLKAIAAPLAGATALFGILHMFIGRYYLV